jgi:hypothetical protein
MPAQQKSTRCVASQICAMLGRLSSPGGLRLSPCWPSPRLRGPSRLLPVSFFPSHFRSFPALLLMHFTMAAQVHCAAFSQSSWRSSLHLLCTCLCQLHDSCGTQGSSVRGCKLQACIPGVFMMQRAATSFECTKLPKTLWYRKHS